jgi:hypothetical protein
MDQTDYLEIENLLRGAAQMLVAGQLNDWQHANTSTFHLLATAVLDLNDRLARLETSSDKPLVITY